jgi:hypothetical protein
MAEKCIVPAEWESYFDNFSKKLKGIDEKITIDLVAPSVSEGEEGKNLTLAGISYDPKDKVLSVFCGDLDHLINKPQEICVEEEGGGVKTIRVTDGTGLEHFIKLSTPLAL